MKACMNGADWQVCEQAADVMGRAGAAGVRVRRTCGPGAARGGLLGRRRSSVFAGARNHRVLWPRHLSPPFPVSGPRDLETGVCLLSSSRRRSWPPAWRGIAAVLAPVEGAGQTLFPRRDNSSFKTLLLDFPHYKYSAASTRGCSESFRFGLHDGKKRHSRII